MEVWGGWLTYERHPRVIYYLLELAGSGTADPLVSTTSRCQIISRERPTHTRASPQHEAWKSHPPRGLSPAELGLVGETDTMLEAGDRQINERETVPQDIAVRWVCRLRGWSDAHPSLEINTQRV